MVAPSIVDPFFRRLHQKLADEIDARSNTLVSGGAFIHGNIGVDAIATAMNYQKAVSYIEALQAVIELGLEIDHDRYGSKRKTEDGDE